MNKYTNNYIGPIQYMVLIIYLSRSFIYYNYLNILNISKNDTWISIILGIIIGFIPIFILKRHIIIKSNKIKFIILILVMILFTLLLSDLTNFISLNYLNNTPIIFIALLFILPGIYIANKDIETIGRSSLFMYYISVLLYLLIIFSIIRNININNLKPILSTNAYNIFKSSILYTFYNIIPLLSLSIIDKNENILNKYKHCLIIGYIISSISSLILIFITITVYNYEYISIFSYPLYFTLRGIKYNFIANFENILSLFFIIDYYYSIITYIYIIKYYLKSMLNKKTLNIIYLVLILILVFISLGMKHILNY